VKALTYERMHRNSKLILLELSSGSCDSRYGSWFQTDPIKTNVL